MYNIHVQCMYKHLACQSFLYTQFARSLNSDMNLYKKIYYGLMNLIQVDFFMVMVGRVCPFLKEISKHAHSFKSDIDATRG